MGQQTTKLKRSIDKFLSVFPNPLSGFLSTVVLKPSRRKFAKPGLAYGPVMGDQELHTHTNCNQLVSTCVGQQNGEKRACKYDLNQSQSKWTHVEASVRPNLTQVENVRWPASTCESVWPGLKVGIVSASARGTVMHKFPTPYWLILKRNREGIRITSISTRLSESKLIEAVSWWCGRHVK